MSNTFLFLTFMLPGTLFLGLYDVLLRSLLRDGKVNERFLLGVIFTGSGLIFLLSFLFIGTPELKPGFWSAYGGTLLLNIFGQWAFYKAFRHEEASFVSPLRLLTPPLVLVTGFFILGEAPSWWGIMGVVVTIAGLFILLRAEAKSFQLKLSQILRRTGAWYAAAGALAFAFSFPLDKKAVITSSTVFFGTLVLLGIGLTSIILSMRRNHIYENLATIRKDILFIALVILIATAGFFLATNALHYAFAAYASSVKRLLSFWAVLFGGAFLKEKNIRTKIAATVIMLAGIAITLLFE